MKKMRKKMKLYNQVCNEGSNESRVEVSELFLLIAILSKVFDFFIIENIIFFVTYSGIIYLYFDINPLYLHTTLLASDDEKHKNELYFPYMKRVWGYFLFN